MFVAKNPKMLCLSSSSLSLSSPSSIPVKIDVTIGKSSIHEDNHNFHQSSRQETLDKITITTSTNKGQQQCNQQKNVHFDLSDPIVIDSPEQEEQEINNNYNNINDEYSYNNRYKQSLWYSSDEILLMRMNAKDDGLITNQLQTYCIDEHAYTGKRRKRRRQSISDVLLQQELLWDDDIDDPELISEVYVEDTELCQLEATERGINFAKYMKEENENENKNDQEQEEVMIYQENLLNNEEKENDINDSDSNMKDNVINIVNIDRSEEDESCDIVITTTKTSTRTENDSEENDNEDHNIRNNRNDNNDVDYSEESSSSSSSDNVITTTSALLLSEDKTSQRSINNNNISNSITQNNENDEEGQKEQNSDNVFALVASSSSTNTSSTIQKKHQQCNNSSATTDKTNEYNNNNTNKDYYYHTDNKNPYYDQIINGGSIIEPLISFTYTYGSYLSIYIRNILSLQLLNGYTRITDLKCYDHNMFPFQLIVFVTTKRQKND